MPTARDILDLISDLRVRLDGDLSLAALAARAGWSPSQLHRDFHAIVGETPKHYLQRLRLERAATRLATSHDPVLAIAAATGFASHAVFTRAFRRHFGRTPTAYRASALRGAPAAARARHSVLTERTGPCVGLFHLSTDRPHRRMTMPTLSIERRELTERPVLFVHLQAARHELSGAIAEGAGKAYAHAQATGLAIAGHPFTRYLSAGPGLMEIEVGLPLDAAAATVATTAGDVQAGVLPGGAAVVAVHAGPYDQLAETYAAMERWMGGNGLRPAGAPWEWYVTDPAEHPDVADWRTEVYWPASRGTD